MTEPEIIAKALEILKTRLHKPNAYFTASQDVKNYLTLQYALLEHETFNVMFLNSQHGLITLKEMFRGTVNASAVYPREVLKSAMQFNAAAVVLAHNHPSGDCEPSAADRAITNQLSKLLSQVDVRVLDHIIVGGAATYSFAENGYL